MYAIAMSTYGKVYYEGIGGQPLKTTDRGVKYPLTPGHEIAGIVDNLGKQVEGFNKNEEVLVYPWIGEGMCPACKIGQENLCDKPRSLGIYNDGGYAEYVLVPNYKYLVKIGDDTDTGKSIRDLWYHLMQVQAKSIS